MKLHLVTGDRPVSGEGRQATRVGLLDRTLAFAAHILVAAALVGAWWLSR